MDILDLQQVIERVKYKRSSIYDLVRAGRFPRPIALGPKRRGWIADEVDTWIRERVAESRSAE
jgi:prophage regulatory protein